MPSPTQLLTEALAELAKVQVKPGSATAQAIGKVRVREAKAALEAAPAPTPPPPVPVPGPTPAPPPSPTPLFLDGFDSPNGPNRLITNEYASWHSSESGVVQSPIWHSDGGSLFSEMIIDAGGQPIHAAYTGKLDNNAADKYSQTNTHSDKMRFWTKAPISAPNIAISASFKGLSWGEGLPESWAGFKFYVRREKPITDSAFYTVEPFLYDGHVRIQKKDRNLEYHVLAEARPGMPSLGDWHLMEVGVREEGGRVTITLLRDGVPVLSAVDDGSKGGAVLPPGHVGFRSDYFQYYLDEFRVTSI